MATEWWKSLESGTPSAGTTGSEKTPETPKQWWSDLTENQATPAMPTVTQKEAPLSLGKFLAEAAVTFADIETKAMAMFTDVLARRPGTLASPGNLVSEPLGFKSDVSIFPFMQPLVNLARDLDGPMLFNGKLAKSWQNLVENTYGKATEQAMEYVELAKQNPYVQPTQGYQDSTVWENLKERPGEVAFHLGANALGSFATFFVGGPAAPAVGMGTTALSTAYDVKQYARADGMDEETSDALALGTGFIVGMLDKAGFEKVFGKETFKVFSSKFVPALIKSGLTESATEVSQETVQMIAESVVRDDMTLSEVTEREVLSFLGGWIGGAGGKALSGVAYDVTNRVNEVMEKPPASGNVSRETPVIPLAPVSGKTADGAATQTKTVQREPLPSRVFSQDASKSGKSLMESMRGQRAATDATDTQAKFQTSIDTKTIRSINIGDPASPKLGSAYEVNENLFIVRDVDVDGHVIGYSIPLDGSTSVTLETVPTSSLTALTVDVATVKKAVETVGVPTGARRSEQFVTNEVALATIRKYFTEEELTVSFIEKIDTPEGADAFGRYTPGMIELINNPHKTTADHESVHAYLNLFYQEGEKEAVFEAAREQSGNKNMSDMDIEEWLADRFARFVRDRSGVTGVIRDFFERVLAVLRRTLRRTNPDKVRQLFDDIRTRRRPAQPKSLVDIREKYYQKADKLTAKIFTFPELADRVTVGRTFLSDFMRSGKANLKQAEYLLLQDVLNTQFRDEDKIDVQAFKAAVEQELLPLHVTDGHSAATRKNGPRYADIALKAEERGDIEDYTERVYESPIETSAGKVHFGFHAKGYFAHTRIEDMADGVTRRVIEVQSDLFQKGRLENEGGKATIPTASPVEETDTEVARIDRFGNTTIRKAGETKAMQDARDADVAKLAEYSQAWWQRIIREEIRDAAMAGKKVLRFPTGETAMKVEGLGDETVWYTPDQANRANATPVDYGSIKTGDELFRSGQGAAGIAIPDGYWVITDVLGDGKFKAIQKSLMDVTKWEDGKEVDMTSEEIDENIRNGYYSNISEIFDISGRVDKENPIYRYYERDVVPYILKSRRGNARLMTDGNGVSWVETALTQEDRGPVLAFQRADEVPEPMFGDLNEAGAVPSPDATGAADESVAAYEVEKELGFIPEPGEMPAGLAADLDYRRNLALNEIQQADMEERAKKEEAIQTLEYGLVFPDSEMENNYQNFKKLARRHKWLRENYLERDKVIDDLVGKASYGSVVNEATVTDETGERKIKQVTYNRFGKREDVIAALFSSESYNIESQITGEELIAQFQNRLDVEEKLIEQVKKKTAAEIRAEAKRLAERAVSDASIKKAEKVKTTVLNINRRPKSEIKVDEMRLLQNRLRDMAKGSKAGFASGKRFATDEILTKWRRSEADRLAIVDSLADYFSMNLPTQQRGRFAKMLAKVKDVKTAWKIMDQVDRVQENFEKRQQISEFAENLKRFKKGAPSISIDYQERIREILSSYEAKKPTANTMRRLNALASFMEKNPDAYIPADVVSQLKRLGRTPIADLTSKDIEELNTTVSELARLGRLKQELKNMYDEREWQKNIDALVAGTVNRDTAAEGALKSGYDVGIGVSDEIMAPARVFDKMDGEKMYSGQNVSLYKKIRSGSQQAEIVSNDIAQDFLEGMLKLGVDALTEEQQRTIYLHSVLEQGNQSSVMFTMEKLGLKELRPLTDQERGVLELAKETLGQQTDDFAATYEEKHNKRFVRVENYVPFRYADANPTSAEDYVLDERMMKRSVEPGSVIERAPEVRRELRLDFVNIVLQAIESQSNYIYLEPAMMDVSVLVKSKEYREVAGVHNSHYWNEYIDAVARNGGSANALKWRWVDPFVRGLRFNVSAAVLAGRLTTIALQPFTLFHAYGMLSMRYGAWAANTLMAELGRTFLSPSAVIAESPALTLREGGDATVRELSDKINASTSTNKLVRARNKVINVLLKPMKELDIRTAAATDQAVYRILRGRGIADAEARAEADFVMDLVAGSSQIADRPLVYSRGEGVRAFTMFMTFALNEWGIVSHDIVKSGLIKGDYQAKLRATFALSLVVGAKMLEQVLRNALRDLMKPEEDDKELPSVPAMLLGSFASVIPWFGPMIVGSVNGYDTQLVESPVVATFEDTYSGFVSAVTGKKESTRQRGWFRLGEGVSTLSGIPGIPLILDWMKDNLIER